MYDRYIISYSINATSTFISKYQSAQILMATDSKKTSHIHSLFSEITPQKHFLHFHTNPYLECFHIHFRAAYI